MWQGDIYWRARGNYVVSWGNQGWPYNATDPIQNPANGVGAFGCNSPPTRARTPNSGRPS
jgi:hypothetical protein